MSLIPLDILQNMEACSTHDDFPQKSTQKIVFKTAKKSIFSTFHAKVDVEMFYKNLCDNPEKSRIWNQQ